MLSPRRPATTESPSYCCPTAVCSGARSVPIPGFLVNDLAVAMADKAPDALIFVSTRGAVLRNVNFRRDVFDPTATDVGLDGLTLHELRHTAASLAVSAGANAKSGPENARSRIGRHDLGCVLRSLRRRPRRGR